MHHWGKQKPWRNTNGSSPSPSPLPHPLYPASFLGSCSAGFLTQLILTCARMYWPQGGRLPYINYQWKRCSTDKCTDWSNEGNFSGEAASVQVSWSGFRVNIRTCGMWIASHSQARRVLFLPFKSDAFVVMFYEIKSPAYGETEVRSKEIKVARHGGARL